jgi:N-acyl-D-amino-acid deacylase
MLCEKSNFKGRVNMGPYSTDAIISEFSRSENCLFMTDAWVEPYGIQNPAIYDCFPKFLQDALLGTGAPISKTIRFMTGATADRFAIAQRGYIREGYFADLVVFDEEKLKSAVPDQERSFGIEKVFLNGALVLDGADLDGALAKSSGRALPC